MEFSVSVSARRIRARKQRRQMRAALGKSWKSKPKHRGKSGRTGSMHEKKNPSRKRFQYRTIIVKQIVFTGPWIFHGLR